MSLKRILWRVGRRIYMRARGEQSFGQISKNGESYLQRCVIKNVPDTALLTIFDIGANQGEWTISLLTHLTPERCNPDHLRLYAFEPVNSTAELFTERVTETTARESIHLQQLAMSDVPGLTRMGVFSQGGGTNSLHYASDVREPEAVAQVMRSTVDGFCDAEGIDRIHLLKCDVEGHDSKVVFGAQGMLQQERISVLQFEYNHRWIYGRAFLKDVFDCVQELPYCVVRVNTNDVTLFDRWHPELERFFQSNYALIHEDALCWFSIVRGHFDRHNTYA